jgi:hypothetical protein
MGRENALTERGIEAHGWTTIGRADRPVSQN